MLPFSKVEPMAALVLQLLCGLDEGSALEGGQGRKEASPHVRETPEGGLEKGQGLQSGRDGWRMRNPPEDGQSEGRRLRAQRACDQRPDAAQPVTPPPTVNLRRELLPPGDLGPQRGQLQLCGHPSLEPFYVIDET